MAEIKNHSLYGSNEDAVEKMRQLLKELEQEEEKSKNNNK